MEKHKELQSLINKLVNHISSNYPTGWSREWALSKLHETVWWLEKAEIDAVLSKKDPQAGKEGSDAV